MNTATGGSGNSNSKKGSGDKESDSSGPRCPYCQSKFKDNEELSKHIDRIHHGSGLLEGDTSKW